MTPPPEAVESATYILPFEPTLTSVGASSFVAHPLITPTGGFVYAPLMFGGKIRIAALQCTSGLPWSET